MCKILNATGTVLHMVAGGKIARPHPVDEGPRGEDQRKRIAGMTLGYVGHDAYEQDDEQVCA
jgi:hypothetical protein